MRCLTAIAFVVAAVPTGASTETEGEALIDCAALIDARYSDPVFAQDEYATISFSIAAMLEIATRDAGTSGAGSIQTLFADRTAAYRTRLGPLSARKAEAGELPDWMRQKFDHCEDVMSRHSDEIAALIVERVLEQ